MRIVLAFAAACCMLALPAQAAEVRDYSGRGVKDARMRIKFVVGPYEGARAARGFTARRVLYECKKRRDFRHAFRLPFPIPINPERTFGFAKTQDFGNYEGSVDVRGHLMLAGRVTGYIQETRVFPGGDVCKTGREKFRAKRQPQPEAG